MYIFVFVTDVNISHNLGAVVGRYVYDLVSSDLRMD